MRRTPWPVSAGSLLVALFAFAADASAWEARFEGTDGHGFGLDVALDAADDVVSAGFVTDQLPLYYRFVVVKHSGLNGMEQWRVDIDGTSAVISGSSNDVARRVRVDGAGDVLAAGTLRNTGTGADGVVVKLAGANGAEVWRRTFDAGGNEDVYDLALAADGDAVTVGTGGEDTAAPVSRLDAGTGTPVWDVAIVGSAGSGLLSRVTLDGDDDVVAAGALTNTGTGRDFSVVKLDGATGTELWRLVVSGTPVPPASPLDFAEAVAVDSANDIVVGGGISEGGNRRFAVLKVAGATGTELWRYVYDRPGGRLLDGAVLALAVDAADNVIAAGESRGLLLVVKLDGNTGAPLWSWRVHSGIYSSARDIALDADGNPLVAGNLGFRFAMVKLHGTTGRGDWRRLLPGNTHNSGQAAASAVDSAGNAVAVGASNVPPIANNGNQFRSYTVLKVCGTNGRVNTTNCP